MRLTVIGCSGSIPGPDSAASCYLLEADGFALVLDLGAGALGPLQRSVGLASIGAVLLSHLHADHFSDVVSLTVASKHGPYERDEPIPLIGPANLVERLAAIYGISEPAELAELHEIFAIETITERTWPIGPFQVTARRVDHPVEAYAFRIEHGGRTLAYSGDCAPCAGLDEVAAGVDLALVEAAYPHGGDQPPGVHQSGFQAGELAARAGVGRLVITHVPPWRDPAEAGAEARAAFTGPVELARPGQTYEV